MGGVRIFVSRIMCCVGGVVFSGFDGRIWVFDSVLIAVFLGD